MQVAEDFKMGSARDPRVQKIQRYIKFNTTITKNDFLDFVGVYTHFHEAGYVVRPNLTKWIQEHISDVLEWLPDILNIRPGYFDDVQPDSKATNFKEYETLAALGLVGPQVEQLPSGRPDSSDLPSSTGVSNNIDMLPTLPRGKILSDFGTTIPDIVVNQRPSLSGQMQQKIWLDDIKEIDKYLRDTKDWLVRSANNLGPDDEYGDILASAAKRIPDFSERVQTAQLCFDDVKTKYDAYRAERQRKVAVVPRFSPSPRVEGQEMTPRQPQDAPMRSSSASIRVVSDIVRERQTTGTGIITPGLSTGADTSHSGTATARFRPVDNPKESAAAAAPRKHLFARRSAMVIKSPLFLTYPFSPCT